jgi:antitoxin (DNA-binding transcriptional repressor) of toxin-antitoxin stability system
MEQLSSRAQCLQIMEQVAVTGQEVRISKRGRPLVRVVPDSVAEPRPAYGFMKDSAQLKDDLYSTGETWDAEHN